jgi:actin-related protein
MEVIWDHCFDEILHVHPSATSVLMTEAHAPADQTRQRTAESMFELFRVDSFYLHTQPVLALYASGLTSGLVSVDT